MDQTNPLSALQGNTPNFAFDFPSAADGEADDQGDLFAAILSQAQFVPPPPIQQPPQNDAANSSNTVNGGMKGADESNSANANGTNGASNANNTTASNNVNGVNGSGAPDETDNSNGDPNGGSNNANASPPAASQITPTGKLPRRQTKTDADNANAGTTANAADGKKPGKPTANQTANNAVSNSPATGVTPGAQNDTNANIGSVTDAGVTPPADFHSNAGATANAAPNADTAAPNPALAATGNPVILDAGLIPGADPKTGNGAPPAGNGDGNTTDPTASTDDPVSNDVMPSHLMMMLMQLEHLATGQAAAQTAPVNLPAANSNVQISNAGVAPQTDSSNGDQGKIDLKALMSAIARLDDSVTNGENTHPQDDNAADISSNATSSPATSAPNTTPAWGNGSSNADSKWISPDFLNLFSLPGNNPAINTNTPAPSPIFFNTGIITGTTTGGDNGASLDSNTQGQTNAGVSNNALLSNNNSLPSALGAAQAASPYDFASQLSALRATQGGATGLPAPIDQVILQLSRNLTKDGSSQMSIQLRPAELGRVDVKLTIGSDGKVQGTVTADNPSTLNLLLKDVRGLERALQEAGLRADSGSLQFGLRGDGQANGGSNQTGGSASGFADDSISSSGTGTILPGFADPAETYYLTPGGVNMRV